MYASSASREREPLRREPAAGGLAVHGLAVHRVVERDERVERDHRPVGPEREHAAGLADGAPRPCPARPLRPDVPGPHADLVGRRVPVVGLHRGHHAQRGEPADVGGVDGLDVLHAVAPGVRPGRRSRSPRVAGPGPVDTRRVLEGVQGQAHAPVADGVHLHLPAAPVGLGDERVELVRLPGRQAALGVVLVGLQHRRRPRLDHAVHEALEDPGVEPVAAAEPEGRPLVLVEAVPPLGQGLAGLHDQRAAEPEAKLAGGVDPAPERELLGRQPRILRGREAQGVHRGLGAADGRAVLVLRRDRDVALDEELRVLLEGAGRLAVRVAHDQAVGRVGRRAVDAGRRAWRRCSPSRCGRRSSPSRRAGRERPGRAAPPWACRRGTGRRASRGPATHGASGVAAACAADGVQHRLDRLQRVELGPGHRPRAALDVDVGVVEAREHEAAPRVDDLAAPADVRRRGPPPRSARPGPARRPPRRHPGPAR